MSFALFHLLDLLQFPKIIVCQHDFLAWLGFSFVGSCCFSQKRPETDPASAQGDAVIFPRKFHISGGITFIVFRKNIFLIEYFWQSFTSVEAFLCYHHLHLSHHVSSETIICHHHQLQQQQQQSPKKHHKIINRLYLY